MNPERDDEKRECNAIFYFIGLKLFFRYSILNDKCSMHFI